MNPIAPTFRQPTSLSCFSIPSIHKVISAAAIITAVVGVAAAIFSSQMFIAIGFAILGVSAAYHAAAAWKKPVVEVHAPQAPALEAANEQLVALQAELDGIQRAFENLQVERDQLQVERDQHAEAIEALQEEIEALQPERHQLAAVIERQLAELDRIQGELGALQATSQAAQVRFAEELGALQAERNQLAAVIERQLAERAPAADAEAARIGIAALEDTIRGLEGQLQAARTQIEDLSKTDEVRSRTFETMDKTIQEIQEENKRLRLSLEKPNPPRTQK
jgi:chromosome segregation ATPase